ncbi:GNAT family N-acetyltransferase [Thermosipho melanesiensis]|uniref:GNAT family N-acetyltransferase n=1 Tax=Thermosipho melanesiensis TaxID=46541 RepID=UPI0027DA539A|nr:GNAT family N-acetyltransferase [Thermosipho melanesiensis]
MEKNFGKLWVSECDVAFSKTPISCFVAYLKDTKEILGFACYDATARGFFAPTGVIEKYRGKGIGKALLIYTLKDMLNTGYAYAIIGNADPIKYYQKIVKATIIKNSTPGIYKDLLGI